MIKVEIKGDYIPERETLNSSGYDIQSMEDFILEPLERRLVSTGIRLAIPQGYEAQVRPRSGLAVKLGITVLNTPGTIDSDYRGEIKVILINLSNRPVRIEKGMRIAQLVFQKVEEVGFEKVEQLDETERGSGGFGSTGI